jgi:hypothetical protein
MEDSETTNPAQIAASEQEIWSELTDMILKWEDGYEPAGDFARRLISWFRAKAR